MMLTYNFQYILFYLIGIKLSIYFGLNLMQIIIQFENKNI